MCCDELAFLFSVGFLYNFRLACMQIGSAPGKQVFSKL